MSSLSCRLQSAGRDVIFGSGIFLEVLSIIALLDVVDCLLGSHVLDVALVIVAESVSVFPFKKQTQTCDRYCITLIRCNQVCIWMNVNRKFAIKVVNF